MKQKTTCPHCNAIVDKGNFCSDCGKKMVEVCECRFLHRPYNCGSDKCPGFGIFPKLIKAKSSSLQPQ